MVTIRRDSTSPRSQSHNVMLAGTIQAGTPAGTNCLATCRGAGNEAQKAGYAFLGVKLSPVGLYFLERHTHKTIDIHMNTKHTYACGTMTGPRSFVRSPTPGARRVVTVRSSSTPPPSKVISQQVVLDLLLICSNLQEPPQTAEARVRFW